MKKRKIIFALMMILFTTVGLAHAFVFPQQTRCLLEDFYSFEKEEVMLNYSTAKYEVAKWYTPKKLTTFI